MARMNDQERRSIGHFSRTVLYPMLAVSLRTCRHPFLRDKKTMVETLDILAAAAWDLLATAYARFEFDLSYFQGLCLLAQVDFASKCS